MTRTSEKEVERADLHHMINVVMVKVVGQLKVRLLNRESRQCDDHPQQQPLRAFMVPADG